MAPQHEMPHNPAHLTFSEYVAEFTVQEFLLKLMLEHHTFILRSRLMMTFANRYVGENEPLAAQLHLRVPGAEKKAVGQVTSCSSALWGVESVLGLWCSSDQSAPVILSKASRWRQRDTCSLLSSD